MSIIPTDWTAVSYFQPHEFACKCGCNKNPMDFNFIQMLDKIRHEFGKPIAISSGYRCPTYNTFVSTTGPTGPHTTGLAADILVAGSDAHEIMRLGYMFGATGVGSSQKGNWGSRFVHLDVIPVGVENKRPWTWSY